VKLENISNLSENIVANEVDGKRYYKIANDISYPSVTTVTGFKKRKFFAEWRKNNPQEAKRVTRRGNNFHSVIEKYLNNEGAPSKEDLANYHLFVNFENLLNNIDNIHLLESALYSDLLKLAGRVDCIAEYNGKLSVIDFKTCSREKYKSDIQEYFMQATAYSIMFKEHTGIAIKNIAILMSCDDGTIHCYEEDPKNYVQSLFNTIKEYNLQLNEQS
jgi:genome maintenance exonuclease 1